MFALFIATPSLGIAFTPYIVAFTFSIDPNLPSKKLPTTLITITNGVQAAMQRASYPHMVIILVILCPTMENRSLNPASNLSGLNARPVKQLMRCYPIS
jgi:hypothetical protein